MKRLITYLSFVVLLVLGMSHCALGQWTTTGYGVYDGFALSVFSRGNVALVGTVYNGVFGSTDGGVTWHHSNSGLGNVQTASFTKLGTRIFAGTSNGVFYSDNNGATWTFSGIPGSYIQAFAISGSNLFAGCYGGPYISTDQGASWTKVDSGLPADISIYRMTASGSVVFIGTSSGEIYSSVDQGANWDLSSFSPNFISSLAANGSHIFAGTNAGLYHSPDYGATWSLQSSTMIGALPLLNVGGTMYLGANMGIYKSTDNGVTWLVATGFSQYPWQLDGDATNMIATLSNTVAISNTGWATWNEPANGLITQAATSLLIQGSHYFGGTYQGIRRSLDGGVTWSFANTGLTYTDVSTLMKGSSGLLAGTNGGGMFRSSDEAGTWVPSTGIPTGFITSFAKMGTKIFAGTNAGVHVSVDDGVSWTSAGMPTAFVQYLASRGTELFAILSNGSVRYSADSGLNWVLKGTLPSSVYGFAASPDLLVAAVDGGLYQSTDTGATWQKLNYNATFTSVIYSAGIFITATYSGKVLLYSGNSFTDITQNLPIEIKATALAGEGSNVFLIASRVYNNLGAGWSRSIASFPTLQPFSPTTGIVGSVLTINGTGFSLIPTGNIVKINGLVAPTISSSPTSIQVLVPGTYGQAVVDVIIGGLTLRSLTPFTVIPKITDVSPAQGYGDVLLAVTGTGIDAPHATSMNINGVLTAAFGEGNTIRGFLPLNATSGPISATISGVSIPLIANYAILPRITSFGPTSAEVGDPIDINGSGFGAPSEVVTVSINGVLASIQSRSPNNIQVTVPPGATSGPVTVRVSGRKATAPRPFLLLPLPEFCFALPPQPTISVENNNSAEPVLTSSSAGGNQWFLNGSPIEGANQPSITATEPGSYSVVVTVLGCASPASIAEDVTMVITGIDSHSGDPGLTLFPNPTTDVISVTLEGFRTGSRVSLDLVDAIGNRIGTWSGFGGNSVSISTIQYPAGVYLVRASSDKLVYFAKFVKR